MAPILTQTRTIDAILDEIAGPQFNVISLAQARAAGADKHFMLRRRRQGRARTVVGSVIRWGPAATYMTPAGLRMEAVLHGGAGSALGLESAATWYGWWDPTRSEAVIRVSSMIERRPVLEHGLIYHAFPNLDESDIIRHNGLPIVSPMRMVADCAATLGPYQLTNLIDTIAARRGFDIDEFERIVRSRGAVKGAATARRSIELYRSGSAGTRSGGEDVLLAALLAATRLVPLVNTRGASGIPGCEPDLVWPTRRVIVELDGRYTHGRPGQAKVDEDLAATLRRAGWIVLRIPGWRVRYELDLVVAEILAALYR